MTSEGKKFENDFKKSVPSDVWFYRFKDGTANFAGKQNDNVRFQASNICDCELYYEGLFLIENKSHLGKSLPHSQFLKGNGGIKHMNEMADAMAFGICAGAIINMRDVNRTFFMYADHIVEHITSSGRKSIPLDYMIDHGFELKAEQKRVRWRYDVHDLLKQIRLNS